MPASADGYKGTWSHMAPELLLPTKFGSHGGRLSKQGDIYAFGVVVYEVLTGRTPFAGEGRWIAEITMRIIEGKRPSKPENAEHIGFGGGTWELVQRCWHESRDERPAVEEIHVHFQGAARTSTVVPPGPTAVARQAESQVTAIEPESRTGNFSECPPGSCINSALTLRPGSPTIHPFFPSKYKRDPTGQLRRRCCGWRWQLPHCSLRA